MCSGGWRAGCRSWSASSAPGFAAMRALAEWCGWMPGPRASWSSRPAPQPGARRGARLLPEAGGDAGRRDTLGPAGLPARPPRCR
jgi:hypothetical protein